MVHYTIAWWTNQSCGAICGGAGEEHHCRVDKATASITNLNIIKGHFTLQAFLRSVVRDDMEDVLQF